MILSQFQLQNLTFLSVPPCQVSRCRYIRWEHDAVSEEMQNLLSKSPEIMQVRKRTVEHPFGTLKQWMGATRFLTRRLAGVSAELSLNVLAYNLKRVMKIIGVNGLMKALSAQKRLTLAHPRGCKAALTCSRSLPRPEAFTVRSLSQRTSMLQDDRAHERFYTLWAVFCLWREAKTGQKEAAGIGAAPSTNSQNSGN